MNQSAFFDLTYGMYMLGSTFNGKPVGCIVNSVTQIGKEPPLLSVSVNSGSNTGAAIKASGLAVVNVLSQAAPLSLIQTFGFQSGRDTDKFNGIDWVPTADDLPVLEEGICGWFECRVKQTVEFPAQTLFILEVFESERLGERETPMTYAYYQMVMKGGVPASAPGHRLPEEEGGPPAGPRYFCSVCNYEYDGSEGPFEFLPPDWKCPRCNAPKSKFVIRA
jgi:flavin reductase (DIM6/NTAB) family NADH-FMN oxidoreductase RutF/rubredoxin